MTKSRNIRAAGVPWSSLEDQLLRELYPDVTCADLAALLERAPGSIYYRAVGVLGLRKSEAFKASDISGRIQRGRRNPAMVSTQFKDGSVPWNKGSHYVAGGRSAETRFKKGQMSGAARHNYVPIGSLRVTKDGYLERKFTDDQALVPARRWVGVHRQVWVAAHGPVPRGHVICFKPGRRSQAEEQITPDCLECLSRGDLARRNHIHSHSPELAYLVRLKGAITRHVNRITREHQQQQGQTA